MKTTIFVTFFLALTVALGVSTAPALAASSSWVQESQSSIEELEALISLLLEHGFSEEEVLSVLEEGDLDVALELQHLLDKGFLIADGDSKKDQGDYTEEELEEIRDDCADGKISLDLCGALDFEGVIKFGKYELKMKFKGGDCGSVCLREENPPVKAPEPKAEPPKTPPTRAPDSSAAPKTPDSSATPTRAPVEIIP